MEQMLGRALRPGEQVHHKNGDPLDNRPENLEVLSSADHMRLHKQLYPDIKSCEWCGMRYRCNPRKRSRQKSCSRKCAYQLAAVRGWEKRRSRKHLAS
jgi:hypothetical protein